MSATTDPATSVESPAPYAVGAPRDRAVPASSTRPH